MTKPRVITLMSDFGSADAYVTAMHGVILFFAPYAVIVDACHDIAAGDIRAASWVLGQYWRLFPPQTVHLAVVDPGVGTDRHALAVEADGHVFLVPDNGVLTWVLREAQEVKLARLKPDAHRPGELSATFHGRDIFAYVAGLLAGGHGQLSDFSEPVRGLVTGDWGIVRKELDRIVGEIVHVDRFGNLITNITQKQVQETGWASYAVQAGPLTNIPLYRTYGDVAQGEMLALYGSSGTLEIAVSRGSAAQSSVLKRGTAVVVVRTGSA